MKRHVIAAIAASTLTLPAFAADAYTVDPNHTFASYEVMHLGFSTQRGRFGKSSGRILLDRAARTGSVDIAMDPATVSIGNPKLEDPPALGGLLRRGQAPGDHVQVHESEIQ